AGSSEHEECFPPESHDWCNVKGNFIECCQEPAMTTIFTYDPLVFGQRLRHWRGLRGLTLAQLGERVGRGAPYLSQVENARREPSLSLVSALAAALEVEPADLLSDEPPSRRAELEIAVVRAQQDPLYRHLGLPPLQPSARLPDEALEHIVRLFEEVKRRAA